jgi:hypothetical protein
MQRFHDLNRWLDSIPVADSSVSRMRTLAFAPAQESLHEVGGEPLAGSGFENEQPETEFAPAGEEN